jgi:hypothetical protein
MDFHLTRGLRLHIDPEHRPTWAIQEIDAEGQQIGSDQIPWPWALYFTATSCALGDSIDLRSEFQMEETTLAPRKVVQNQVIRVTLRPGRPPDDADFFRQTTFSMFGTDRSVQSFELTIRPIADPATQESCSAWGSVSHTTEIDFRNETTDDCIVFSMYVKPDTFARYGAKIAHGLVDEMVLSVGSVAGFYSERSPEISTSDVKVLTEGSGQNITLPSDHRVEPPRLGDVGEAELYINRHLEFAKRAPEPEAVEEMAPVGTERAVSETQALAPADPRVLEMLGSLRSLRQATWVAVCLLALIFIAILLKR